MSANSGGVFAIHYTAFEVEFLIGFCEGWIESGRRILLQRPFTRSWSLSMGHHTFYRGKWKRPLAIAAERYSVEPISQEPWMLITYEDLLAAAIVLTECSVQLDPLGFNRLS